MNISILMGRLTRDPEVRYSQGAEPLAIARYTLAVKRRFKTGDENDTDFISCVAFGKMGEFAEKYLKQGTKVIVTGRIQTGSYTNKDGNKVYTTDVIVEEQEFAESKGKPGQEQQPAQQVMQPQYQQPVQYQQATPQYQQPVQQMPMQPQMYQPAQPVQQPVQPVQQPVQPVQQMQPVPQPAQPIAPQPDGYAEYAMEEATPEDIAPIGLGFDLGFQ